MKLGLLTAPFPRRSLTQVAEWASGAGFEMLEVACWPAAGGERRRYAGTSHIDVSRLDDGVKIDLHVVVEHGLNLAEVAATVRSQVAYEVGRLTGLQVAAVEVHIQNVRQSA